MSEVTETPPSFVAAPGSPAPKEHWKVREKRLREEAEEAAQVAAKESAKMAPAPAVAMLAPQPVAAPPVDAPKTEPVAPAALPTMPVGGWPGDTPPTLTGPSIDPVSVAPPSEPARILPFHEFVERFFTTNMIRQTAYEAPKMIRSVAADCVAAYHAYCYTIALGYGIASRSPESRRFGGVLALANDLAKAVALMDREMDGR